MKKIYLLLSFFLALSCTKSGNNLAGTVTDSNSGSITGIVLYDGKKFMDSVTFTLYSGDAIRAKQAGPTATPSDSFVTVNGEYRFDSLAAGTYSIKATKDGLVVGQQLGIVLSKGEKKTVNITIVIIINQTFNITNVNNSRNVTINNFYFIGGNGNLDTTANGKFLAAFPQRDTVSINVTFTTNGITDTALIVFVRKPDGTYASLPLDAKSPIAVKDGTTIIYAGTGSDSSSVKINGHIQEQPDQQ